MTACLGRANNGCVEGYLSILKQDVSGCAMELVINEFLHFDIWTEEPESGLALDGPLANHVPIHP